MSVAHRYNGVLFAWLKEGTKRGDRIVDFGSGIGEFCNRFVDAGYESVFSVEIDASMHSFNRCPCAVQLNEYENTFDMVYSCNVLEHIAEDGKTARELYEALKPGGRIKIFVPAKQVLYSEMDRAVGHYRRYEKRALVRMMEEAGFEITECRYFDFLGFLATLVYKWIKGSGTINQKSIAIYDRFIFPLSHMIDRMTGGRIVGKNLLLEGVKPL